MRNLFSGCRRFILLSSIVITAGCSQWQTQKELEKLSKAEIYLPADMEVVQNGRLVDSDCREFIGNVKLIIYYASDGCTPCRVGHLPDMAKLFEIDSAKRFTPVVIFTPQEEQYQGLLNLLRQTPFRFPVFIDKSQGFTLKNYCIPTDPRFHTFLLDKNNRVVLVGNPMVGEAMWNLFKLTLDNMLANDGVYVPE